jgi:uncharacterized protein (DUF433 family)
MNRITKNKDDQPSIRDLNLKVSDMFRLLGSGQTEQQIIENHAGLEREDFLAVYQYASRLIEPFDIEEFKEQMAGYAERMKRIGFEVKEKLEALKISGPTDWPSGEGPSQ